MLRVSSGFPNTRKQYQSISFLVFGNPDETLALVFEILLEQHDTATFLWRIRSAKCTLYRDIIFLFHISQLCDILDISFLDILFTSKFPAPHRSSIDVERFEFDLLRAFQMEWFEIAIWPRKTSEEVPEYLAPDQVIDSFPTSSPYRKPNRNRSARRNQRGRLHSDSGLYS